MTNGQDRGQPYDPWQPQQYDPATHQRRLQGPPQEPPSQQPAYQQQGYGQPYPQDEPWPPQQYDPQAHQQRIGAQQQRPQAPSWQQPGYGQPPIPPQQPGYQSGPPPRRKSWPARHKVLTGLIVFVGLCVISGIANAVGGGNKAASSPNTPTATATVAASATAVASKPSFPPKTLADFRAFAATGDASQVHQVASSTEGLPSCPEPNFYVTVSQALTGKVLEADLSAFFVQHGLLGNQCQAFVFAFHSKSDYLAHQGDGFTAGRVALTTNSGSGPQMNLEVDAGSAVNTQAESDFNF